MAAKKLFTQIFIYFSKPLRLLYFTQIFSYFSKPLRLLYSLIIYEIVNFSFFTLYSLLLLSFFLYLKSVPIYVIVHVHVCVVRGTVYGVKLLMTDAPSCSLRQQSYQSEYCHLSSQLCGVVVPLLTIRAIYGGSSR